MAAVTTYFIVQPSYSTAILFVSHWSFVFSSICTASYLHRRQQTFCARAQNIRFSQAPILVDALLFSLAFRTAGLANEREIRFFLLLAARRLSTEAFHVLLSPRCANVRTLQNAYRETLHFSAAQRRCLTFIAILD